MSSLSPCPAFELAANLSPWRFLTTGAGFVPAGGEGRLPEGDLGGGGVDGTAEVAVVVGDELETRLAAIQDRLAMASTGRQTNAFRTILHGSSGVGGWYDRWRRARARWAGREFEAGHGDY